MSRTNGKTEEEEEEKRRSRGIFFTNYLQIDERLFSSLINKTSEDVLFSTLKCSKTGGTVGTGGTGETEGTGGTGGTESPNF